MRLRSCIAATLLLAAGSPALAAQGPESMTIEPFAEAVVELHINDQPAPVTLVVRRDVDGTLLVRAADLEILAFEDADARRHAGQRRTLLPAGP